LIFDEFEQAGAIQRADVAIDHRVVELTPLANLHVGPHDLLIDVRRSDELDRDGTHRGAPAAPDFCVAWATVARHPSTIRAMTTTRRATRKIGLLCVVFKAGDVS
jgi:hypothetical protein